MRTNGSVYVSVVVALLVAYFSYQWWYNPRRAIKRQLGELAATLSVPPGGGGDIDRLARVARLRNYFAPDVRISTGASRPELTSRDALVGAVAAWTPPAGGWDVTFVDVQISLDSDTTARAYMTVEIASPDPRSGQPAYDAREVRVELAEQEGAWVITTAEPVQALQRP
jgi:SnoaL-like domain